LSAFELVIDVSSVEPMASSRGTLSRFVERRSNGLSSECAVDVAVNEVAACGGV
jgi:hypothetical protein